MIRLSALVLLCAFLAGCSSPSSHIVTGEVRDAVLPSEVVIYQGLREDYAQIAVVSAYSSGYYSEEGQASIDEVIESLKSEAASLGANGIILTDLYDEVVNEKMTTYDGMQSGVRDVVKHYRRAQGVAIYIE